MQQLFRTGQYGPFDLANCAPNLPMSRLRLRSFPLSAQGALIGFAGFTQLVFDSNKFFVASCLCKVIDIESVQWICLQNLLGAIIAGSFILCAGFFAADTTSLFRIALVFWTLGNGWVLPCFSKNVCRCRSDYAEGLASPNELKEVCVRPQSNA